MKPHPSYSGEEHRRLRRSFLLGERLECPRCRVELDRRAVPPRPDVSYVRNRLWVSCSRCHATAVLDEREAR